MRLANKIQDLGFGVIRKRDDFEITGIRADVLKRFSRRTTIIEKMAEERGIDDPDRKAELGAETRERKAKSLSWAALRQEWLERLTRRNAIRSMRSCVARPRSRDRNRAKPWPSITRSATATSARRWSPNASS